MRGRIALLLALVVLLAAAYPAVSATENGDAVLLARVLYAMAGQADYDTKLRVATVAMNRVASPWYPDTLAGVLGQRHQFPSGSRYDEESLRAARAALSGKRALDGDVTALKMADGGGWTCYVPDVCDIPI